MNQIATIAPGSIQLPASLQGVALPTTAKDLSQGVGSVPVLSIRGRVFRFKYQGNEDPVVDQNGYALPYLDVIIVKGNPNLSKIFYPAAFVEGNDDPPTCFSLDGVAPDATVVQKQALTCGACQHNIWGSKVTPQGRPTKSCADGRRLAIVPAYDPMNQRFGGPALLRIPPASLGELAAYSNMLASAQAHYFAVVTRISFDQAEAYPKLVFQCMGAINEQQGEAVKHWLIGAGKGNVDQLLVAVEVSAGAPAAGVSAAPIAQPVAAVAPTNPYGVQPGAAIPQAYAPQPMPPAPVPVIPAQPQYPQGYTQPAAMPVVAPPPPSPPPPQPVQGPDGNWYVQVNGQWQLFHPPAQPQQPQPVAPVVGQPAPLQPIPATGTAAAPPPAAQPPTGTRRGRPRATAQQPVVQPTVQGQPAAAFVPPPPGAPLPLQPGQPAPAAAASPPLPFAGAPAPAAGPAVGASPTSPAPAQPVQAQPQPQAVVQQPVPAQPPAQPVVQAQPNGQAGPATATQAPADLDSMLAAALGNPSPQ